MFQWPACRRSDAARGTGGLRGGLSAIFRRLPSSSLSLALSLKLIPIFSLCLCSVDAPIPVPCALSHSRLVLPLPSSISIYLTLPTVLCLHGTCMACSPSLDLDLSVLRPSPINNKLYFPYSVTVDLIDSKTFYRYLTASTLPVSPYYHTHPPLSTLYVQIAAAPCLTFFFSLCTSKA